MSTQVHPGAVGRVDRGFLSEVCAAAGGRSRLEMCIQCGTCGGSCPSAADMNHTPRMLFAMIRAGMRDAVLASNTPWMCVSCHFCVVRCPQDVHITDVMYTLKGIATKAGRYPDASPPDFSRIFVDNILTYGRSFEVGLIARYYLRHQVTRLPDVAPMGLGMFARRRVGLRPKRIRGVTGLRAILDRAAVLETAQ